MDRFVGEDEEIVVYLDVDVVVRRSICDLARMPLDGALFGACVDLSHLRIGSPTGLPDWRGLGLDPTEPYVNSGVLVANIQRWRNEGFGEEMLTYLERRGDGVRFMDQDAINACGYGRWKPLDMRWNVTTWPWVYPKHSWTAAVIPQDRLVRAYEDPWIVHYAGPMKPWLPQWESAPLSSYWWQAAERTDFRFRTGRHIAHRVVRKAGHVVGKGVRTLRQR
jgi:lipopolysaccharide biosynthesis glycosyltransferase